MKIQLNPAPGTPAAIWPADKIPTDAKTGKPVVVVEMSPAEFDAWLASQPSIPESGDPVPTNLPAWRIRVVLKRRGLLNNVKQLIASLPKEARDIAEEQLVDSKFERHHPLIDQLGAALGLTSDDLDDIFREADALV